MNWYIVLTIFGGVLGFILILALAGAYSSHHATRKDKTWLAIGIVITTAIFAIGCGGI